MKFVYLHPTASARRYVDGLAPKGATLFRLADYDAMRLASLCTGPGDFTYLDERVEDVESVSGADLAVIKVEPPAVGRAFELGKLYLGKGIKVALFGPYATLQPGACEKHGTAVVCGDITSVWPQLVCDLREQKLKKRYEGSTGISFTVNRRWEDKVGLFPYVTQLWTGYGCTCRDENERAYCRHGVNHEEVVTMDVRDAIAEVAAIKKKIIWLQDDDIFSDMERAEHFFRHVWQFKKEWVLQTSDRIFAHRGLLRTLRDSGVRIIILKEEWLPFSDLSRSVNDPKLLKQKRRQIDAIHHSRILAGVRLRLDLAPGDKISPMELHDLLIGLRADFVELAMSTPLPGSKKYRELRRRGLLLTDSPDAYDWHTPVIRGPLNAHVIAELADDFRDRFYSWDSILTRCAKTFSRAGIYNTLLFNLSTNLAHRENMLERAGYPP